MNKILVKIYDESRFLSLTNLSGVGETEKFIDSVPDAGNINAQQEFSG